MQINNNLLFRGNNVRKGSKKINWEKEEIRKKKLQRI